MSIRRMQRLLPLLIGFVLLVIIGLLPVSLPTEDDTSTLIPSGGAEVAATSTGATSTMPRPIGGVFAGVTVMQEFPAAGTEISAAALVLATYQRANSGTIQVMMQTQTNGQWQTLGSRTVEKTTLRDNGLYTVRFNPPLGVKRGQIMRIVLQADGDVQNAISWWINPSDQRPGFALFLNGNSLPGTAQFEISYARASGRLAGMIGPVLARMTIFLDSLWRAVLGVGILVLLGSFLVLGRYLPGRAWAWSQPPSPSIEEQEAFSHASSSEEETGEAGECNQDAERILADPPNERVDR